MVAVLNALAGVRVLGVCAFCAKFGRCLPPAPGVSPGQALAVKRLARPIAQVAQTLDWHHGWSGQWWKRCCPWLNSGGLNGLLCDLAL